MAWLVQAKGGGRQGPGDIAVPYTHVVVSYPAASWRHITNARDFRAIPGWPRAACSLSPIPDLEGGDEK